MSQTNNSKTTKIKDSTALLDLQLAVYEDAQHRDENLYIK